VQFYNESTGDFDTCTWDYGDNESSDDCDDPVHIYKRKGNYTVSLTVSGPGGDDTLTRKKYITVLNPLEDFYTAPIPVSAPLTTQFFDSASNNFDSCVWDIDDESTFIDCLESDKPIEIPSNLKRTVCVTLWLRH
jgi:PKD repeat protein